MEEDFIKSKPELEQLVIKFHDWKIRLENVLDNRSTKLHLEHFSHYLVEFEHQRFDDVEMPGQYLNLTDSNNDFVKIDRFMPELESVRSTGIWYRRLVLRGHNGSLHPFTIRNPSARHSRREERILQLFRIFNRFASIPVPRLTLRLHSALLKKKESKSRDLFFHLPSIVPLSPVVRLVQDDASYVSLQDVLENHFDEMQLSRDVPSHYFLDRIKVASKCVPNVLQTVRLHPSCCVAHLPRCIFVFA